MTGKHGTRYFRASPSVNKLFCVCRYLAAAGYGLDAGANRPQQECRKVRMIGRLAFRFARRPQRFGTAD